MRTPWLAVALVTGAALPALPAAPAAAQGGGPPRFELSADTVLVDERVGIALSGLPPDGLVTIRLSAEGGARSRASASYRADARGRVDLARIAPVSGDYAGVHPMGLFWSMRPDPAAGPPPAYPGPLRTPDVRRPPPQPVVLSADVDGRVVALDTLWRLAVAPSVRIVPVRERGLVGTAYFPPGDGPHPAVIVLGGSLGGITPPSGPPGGLASRGYVVLALAYFAAEGLPDFLVERPLEYFETAIRWLAEQPPVDPARIGVYGVSKGAELALLLGATYPALRAVVAYLPSHVVWPGVVPDSMGARLPRLPAAWTLAGRPLPGMYAPPGPEALARHAGCPGAPTCAAPLMVHRFLARLDDTAAAARAAIPVERIDGAVLLVSGREDGVWPSTLMAERVVARLRSRGFRHPVEHLAYPRAGHAIGRPYAPGPGVTEVRSHPISGVRSLPGGTVEGSALASEDAWRRMLEFLNANLRARRDRGTTGR